MKKELLRVLKDPRLIIMLILPGILIFVMYTFMGNLTNDMRTQGQDETYNIITINMTDNFLPAPSEEFDYVLSSCAPEELPEKLILLRAGSSEVHIIIVVGGDEVADDFITVFYNPEANASNFAYQEVQKAVASYRNFGSYMIIDESNALTGIVSQLIPFLLLTFLFSGCMGVAPDAIAGEKERGTISTILITPAKRGEIALGKIFALSVLAIISAASSFVGLMLSLPNLMGLSLSMLPYGIGDYLLIFLVLVSTVLLIIGVMAILSAFAKTVKEANMLLMPFMFLSMLVGLVTMVNSAAATSFAVYMIPLYNTVQAIISILSLAVNPVNLIITVISNLIYMAASAFALTKLFNNEKVMFKK